jgi:hypothetical protein
MNNTQCETRNFESGRRYGKVSRINQGRTSKMISSYKLKEQRKKGSR